MLDTGDGAALCFLGDPRTRCSPQQPSRRTWRSGPELAAPHRDQFGPVRIVKDVNGQPNMLGDGINVAQRVMSFAGAEPDPGLALLLRDRLPAVQSTPGSFSTSGPSGQARPGHEVYVMSGGGRRGGAGRGSARRPPAPPGRVEARSSCRRRRPRFEPAVLARLEGALAECIGPLRVCSCARPPRRRRTSHAVPGPRVGRARARIRRRSGIASGPGGRASADAGASGGGPPPRPASAPGKAGTPPRRPRSSPRPPSASPSTSGLSPSLLVKRAAKQASRTRDFYERLARHIDDPKSRQRFVAATEELSEP